MLTVLLFQVFVSNTTNLYTIIFSRNFFDRLIKCCFAHMYMVSINKPSSSSSCHNARGDLPDPLQTPFSIVHRSLWVFKATSCIGTEVLYVGSSQSSYICSFMWRATQEYVTYEFVPTSPAVSRMPGSSNWDSFHDGL